MTIGIIGCALIEISALLQLSERTVLSSRKGGWEGGREGGKGGAN